MNFAVFVSMLTMGIGVASDAFAMTVSNVLQYGELGKKKLLLPVMYALFQAVMPLIGYFIGQMFDQHIEQFAHWLALILLCGLGIRTIVETYYDNRQSNCEESCELVKHKTLTFGLILTQAVATSIDAMLVGISLAMVADINIWLAVVIIFAVTFIACSIALFLGRVGKFMKGYAGYLGGLILIAMGFKIFIQYILIG